MIRATASRASALIVAHACIISSIHLSEGHQERVHLSLFSSALCLAVSFQCPKPSKVAAKRKAKAPKAKTAKVAKRRNIAHHLLSMDHGHGARAVSFSMVPFLIFFRTAAIQHQAFCRCGLWMRPARLRRGGA